MTIIRIQKSENYTILPNHILNDSCLSWEARGLLAYLLSKPDGWQINSRALAKQGPAGREKIQRILRELERAGYLERKRVRGPQGRFVWESIIREQPRDPEPEPLVPADPEPEEPSTAEVSESSLDYTMAGFSVDGKTVDGKTVDGKPGHLINTELTNTDLASTDQTNTDRANTREVKSPAAAINARALNAPPTSKTAAAVQKLPKKVLKILNEIGWRGKTDEIAAHYARAPQYVLRLLRTAQERQWGGGLLRMALREGWDVDATADEDKYKDDPYRHLVERVAQQAHLDGVTPHVLRHTFAKSLVDAGVGLEQVAELLGHDSMDTTRRYVLPGERDLERAVEALTG